MNRPRLAPALLMGLFLLLPLGGAAAQQLTGSTGKQTMNELGREVEAKAALAVTQFQERAAGKLDYSSESLAIVEEMLAEAAEYADQMGQESVNALVQLMGSYILQVAYQEHGGTFYWHDAEDQPVLVVGEPAFRVALISFNKVRGRLSGDEGDNIPFFYSGFSDRAKSATPGTDALYM